jgi:hypothetical protein
MRSSRTSFLLGVLLSLVSALAVARPGATWIWYPGDFEIWLGNQVQVKRVQQDVHFMPFWRLYSHQPQMNFTKAVDLAEAEDITVLAEGMASVAIDKHFVHGDQQHIHVPAGKHTINVQVFNQVSPPAIYVDGPTIHSDGSWSAGPRPDAVPPVFNAAYAAHWNFDRPESRPSQFKLATRAIQARSVKTGPHSILVDFGEETIGFVRIEHLAGRGRLSLYYGETPEEAQAAGKAETLDRFTVDAHGGAFVSPNSRALRYVNIQFDEGMRADGVSLLYEYLPVTHRGSFRSSDDELNRIWNVAQRTLELNTREFFLDGIKRDHWVWAGDAVQAYLMNYYTFFDSDTVKRTTWALRGADPVDMHINTILDYSLYWFIGISDYYQYTGDAAFVKSVYPRMVSLMDFVLGRRDADGMLQGLPGDWVFVDWARMPKDGELSVIQILFARSLEAMADCARIAGDDAKAAEYRRLATDLRAKIIATFWDPELHALVHSRKDGRLNRLVTRHPNMFALMLGYLDADKAASVKREVLLNDRVPAITTPYMRFYELAALAESGQYDYVLRQIKDYWGGMLRAGATCFWEQYDPGQSGVKRYAMYGEAFGMSLCHAWGASPLYLLGKYYLGVRPVRPGYAEYLVEPHLGGMRWMEGRVPTPRGDIAVSVDQKRIRIVSPGGQGVLRFSSMSVPVSASGTVRSLGAGLYELPLDGVGEYVVDYALPAAPSGTAP